MAARPAQDGRTLAWVVRWVSASAVRRATKEARENGGIHRRHVMLPIGPADSPARSRAHPDLGQQSRSVPTDTTLISACSQKTIARIDLHGTPPNHSVSGRRRIAKSHTASARAWAVLAKFYKGHFHVTTWVSRKCRSAHLVISPRRSEGEDWTCRVSIKPNNTQ